MSTPKPPNAVVDESHPDTSGTLPTVIGPRTLEPGRADDSASIAESFPIPGRGSLVGRYVILEEIGRGAMGVVLAAYDPRLDRKVAIKVIRTARDRERDRERVVREAQAMAQVRSAHVVAVYDAGELDGRVFITMEFIAGTTLRSLLDEQARPWREIVRMYVDAARGLQAAHDAGLVHRDFKPENVLLDGSGRVAVSDFGLARLADEARVLRQSTEAKLTSTLDTELTRTGELLGTPAYMSPEQWTGLAGDARSDQFSFCVALYRTLFRKPPFPGSTPTELMASVSLEEPEPPPSDLAPRRVRRAIMRGLARDHDDRFANMGPLIAELEGALARRRRTSLAVGALGLAAGGYALVTETATPAAPETCEDGADSLDELWSDERRVALAGHFETEQERAWWQKTEAVIDRFADEWKTIYREACELDSVSREPVLACLERRGDSLRGMLSSLDGLRAKAATFATFTSSLSRPTDCRPGLEPGEQTREISAALAAKVTEVLAEAQLVLRQGDAQRALAMADSIDWAGLGAEGGVIHGRALMLRSNILQALDRREDAMADLQRAMPMALRADDYDIALQIAIILGETEAEYGGRPGVGRMLVAMARSWLPKASGRNWLAYMVAHGEGLILAFDGEHDEARRVLGDALDTADADDSWHIRADLAGLLVRTEIAAGDPSRGVSTAERLVADARERFGEGHPEELDARAAAAHVCALAGQVDAARRHVEAAGAADETWSPRLRRSMTVAQLRIALHEGDVALALRELERWEARGGEVDQLEPLVLAATVRVANGDVEGAARSIRAAEAIESRTHAWLRAERLAARALVLHAQGRDVEALAALDEVEDLDPPVPPGHFVLRNLAQARATIESDAGAGVVGEDG